MKNKQTIVVLDFETGSSDPRTTEPIQIAAVAINPSTLEIYDKTAFESLMKPKNFESLQDEALKVNGKTREMLQAAPERSIVWKNFLTWIKQFNPSGKYWSAPIMAGHNIIGFDWIIYERLCHEFGNLDKDKQPNLFSTYMRLDTLPLLFTWFEATDDLPKYKLDVIRDHFGMNKDGAHDALVDVIQTAQILCRFLKFQRDLYKVHGQKFKGCFSKSKP